MHLHRYSISSLLASALTLSMLSGCQKTEPDSSAHSDLAKSSESSSKVIQVGSDITFPPFEFMDNDQPAGFDIDIMNGIAKHAGASTHFIDTRFSNLIPGLNGKKFDTLISGLYITPERLKVVDMIPYFMATEAVISLADSSYQPKVRDDLCGKVIATQKGSLFPSQLQQISKETCLKQGKKEIVVREFETSPESVQAILSKAADAQYGDASVAKTTVVKLNGRVVVSSTEPFFPILGGIAVRKGDTENYQMIQDGLEKMKASGEYQKLIEKYDLEMPSEQQIQALMHTSAP